MVMEDAELSRKGKQELNAHAGEFLFWRILFSVTNY
jgi:hypothetical protein